MALRMRSRKEPSGVWLTIVLPGFRRRLAEDVTQRRRLYTTKVFSEPCRDSGIGSLKRCARLSTTFCAAIRTMFNTHVQSTCQLAPQQRTFSAHNAP